MARLPPERHRPFRSRFWGPFTPGGWSAIASASSSGSTPSSGSSVPPHRSTWLERLLGRCPSQSSLMCLAYPRTDNPGSQPPWRRWVALWPDSVTRPTPRWGNPAVAGMLDYFDQALREREQEPRDDLLTP